jgi:MFS transporter, FHS family, glucose/mannose:H+ symporter
VQGAASRGVIARCVVLFGLLGLFQSTLGPLIPVIRDDNELSSATAGLLVSGFYAGSLVSTAAAGALGERWARRYLVAVPTALLALGAVGLAWRGPWPVPLLAAAVAGLGFGGLVLVVNTAMAGQPGERGVALANLVNGVFGLGAAAGPALVGLTRDGGYQYVFAALAVAVLLALPPLGLGGSTHLPSVAGRPRGRPVVLALFCALLFCYAGAETGLSSWESVHLEAHGYATATASALTSLFWVGLAAGRLLVPFVTAGWAPPRIVTTALVAIALPLVLIGIGDVAPAGYLLAGLVLGPIFPTVMAWNASTHPDPRRSNAVIATAGMVGNVALPAAVGYSMQATSHLALPVLVTVPVLACLAITAALRRRHTPATSEQ